jgi:hypothetical protein
VVARHRPDERDRRHEDDVEAVQEDRVEVGEVNGEHLREPVRQGLSPGRAGSMWSGIEGARSSDLSYGRGGVVAKVTINPLRDQLVAGGRDSDHGAVAPTPVSNHARAASSEVK